PPPGGLQHQLNLDRIDPGLRYRVVALLGTGHLHRDAEGSQPVLEALFERLLDETDRVVDHAENNAAAAQGYISLQISREVRASMCDVHRLLLLLIEAAVRIVSRRYDKAGPRGRRQAKTLTSVGHLQT
ncbi:hypothetical protein, partial [Nocardia xishanensis]